MSPRRCQTRQQTWPSTSTSTAGRCVSRRPQTYFPAYLTPPRQAIISSKVPALTSKAVPPLYHRLISSPRFAAGPSKSTAFLSSPASSTPAANLDWLIHPGGSLIISKLEAALGIAAADHTKASWAVYRNKGNTSSVSIGAVIEESRRTGGREGCIAVAFGPGVTVEMSLFRRTGWKGRKEDGAGAAATNGLAHGTINGHANGNGLDIHGVVDGHGVIDGKVNGVTNGVSAIMVGQ